MNKCMCGREITKEQDLKNNRIARESKIKNSICVMIAGILIAIML